MKVTLIAIDLAKNIFQVCGVNQAGKPLFNRQVKRNRLIDFLLQHPEATVAMEACSGSNYWGRTLEALGFKVMLIPPQHVKPFVKGNKNDRNDAFAISEAARRPNLQRVRPRSLEQTDMVLVHRIRERLVSQRTSLINQLRGIMAEYGVIVRPGKEYLYSMMPDLLEDADNGLTHAARALCAAQVEEWRSVNDRITALDKEIQQQARGSEATVRLMKIKGVAEKTATAGLAMIGNGKAYRNGRHFAANLGLTPKEHSSGGKQQLGGITKRGNPYLRRLLIQGAWSVVRNAERNNEDRLSKWAKQLIARRGKHKAVVAVANKIARMMWSMLYHGTEYKAV